MICIAYLSSAAAPMSPDQLGAILGQAQANNARRGVTGLLCHYDGSFLQFLEGEPEDVDALFATIRADPRHGGVIEVLRQAIAARAFPDWTMAMVSAGEAGGAHAAFCQNLRQVELAADAAHRSALQPFLNSFRAWLR